MLPIKIVSRETANERRAHSTAARRPQWKPLSRIDDFLRDENGAAYSLNLVLLFPFYTLLIAAIVECSLLLLVKMGTQYAAYRAARAAIVWVPAEEGEADKYQDLIRLAAVQAMTPLASGSELHAAATGDVAASEARYSEHLVRAYHAYADAVVPDDYLTRKWLYALKATQVEIKDSAPGEFNSEITATVTYEAPFHMPGVGRFLGRRPSWPGARFFTRQISSTVTLEKEGPKSDAQTLGIDYYRRDL